MSVWFWLKANWKWLLLPVWAASLILVWVFRGGDKPLFPISGTTDEAADKALKEKDEAIRVFRSHLDDLAKKAEARMQDASAEQIKEMKELQGKPLEDVVKWIDGLS